MPLHERARSLAAAAPSLGLPALRGLAGCGAVFVGANLLVAQLDGGVDTNQAWLGLRELPAAVYAGLEALLALSLLAFAARPRTAGPAARARALVLAAAGLAGLASGIRALPESPRAALLPLLATAALAVLLLASRPRSRASAAAPPSAGRAWLAAAGGALLFGAALPLAAIASTGRARELAPAAAPSGSVAVVFGAGVSGDGAPSLALADRVRTAVALHRDGLVDELWCSGGPGPGAVHETEAMERLATSLGVPAAHVRRDVSGVSTWATAERAAAWARARPGGAPRLVAVSHGYHLARVALAFERHGLAVVPVPARETRGLARLPWYVAREVGGYWIYWARRAAAALVPGEAVDAPARSIP